MMLQPHSQEEDLFFKKVRDYPKTELHVHLEAAVSSHIYESWSGGCYEIMPANRAPFASLQEFISAWVDHSKLIVKESQFQDLAISFVKDRVDQNITYTEAHCSPVDVGLMRSLYPQLGPELSFKSVLLNILEGLNFAQKEHKGTDIRLIVDVLWPTSAHEKMKLLEPLNDVLHNSLNTSPHGGKRIVAVGLGGPQKSELATDFVTFFNEVRSMGLKVDLHCGETGTAAEMLHILNALTPDRIGHGLANALGDWVGHICACPLSNKVTGSFVDEWGKHPVNHWQQDGVPFSIHSDDPLLFQTELATEFLLLFREYGWGFERFLDLQKEARGARFAQA